MKLEEYSKTITETTLTALESGDISVAEILESWKELNLLYLTKV